MYVYKNINLIVKNYFAIIITILAIISLSFNVTLWIHNVNLLMSLLYVFGLLGLAGLSYIDRDLVKFELEKRLTLCLFFMGFLLVFLLLLVLCYGFYPPYFKIC